MHTYRKTKDEPLWTVGYYARTDGGYDKWMPLSDHDNETDARFEVHFLNGGSATRQVGFSRAAV